MTNDPDPVVNQPALEPEFVEPPRWPKTVGIISVGWGILSLGCLGCAVVGLLVPSFFSGAMAQQFPDGLPPQMTQGPSIAIVALLAVSVALAALLIAAGAVLLARRPAARWLHLAWAVAAILGTFASTAMQVKQSQDTRQWIRDHPNTKFAQQQAQFGSIGETIGIGVGLLFGLGYPIFCCVWFGFVKKNPEEYSRGIEQLM